MFNQIFANYIYKEGLLSDSIIQEKLELAQQNNTPLYVELIKTNALSEQTVYKEMGKYFNLPVIDVQVTELDLGLVSKFSRDKLLISKAIPYREDNEKVIFIISAPNKIDDVMELKHDVNKKYVFNLITNSKMEQLLGYVNNKVAQQNVLDVFSSENSDITEVTPSDEDTQIDAPIITLCDSILKDATSRGASDIHIEPFEDEITVRYRIDGKLITIDRLKPHLFQSILARYKIMSEMNIAERRIPQDGKIQATINGSAYDFRASTIPTINGEKLVIRIYNKNLETTSFDKLGLYDYQSDTLLRAITRPHGIILLTGPTGSGKSSTLYACLRYLNKEDTNIITVEDPVENVIKGINQVQVNPKANMTFANALRSILRQDPNIIMIGEIRDEETVQIATRAALTGHLVMSTIHTNSAAGVVTRLINMGIPSYLVADALLCSISQRLVRRLCPACKVKRMTTKTEMQALKIKKAQEIYDPKGCAICNNTGYNGRIAVFEIIPIDNEVRNLITDVNFTSDKLNEYCDSHFEPLLENARKRVLSGDTSIVEYQDLCEFIVKD